MVWIYLTVSWPPLQGNKGVLFVNTKKKMTEDHEEILWSKNESKERTGKKKSNSLMAMHKHQFQS